MFLTSADPGRMLGPGLRVISDCVFVSDVETEAAERGLCEYDPGSTVDPRCSQNSVRLGEMLMLQC